MNIVVSEELRKACPQFKGAAVFATVENTPYSAELWDEIGKFIAEYRSKYTIDSIKDMPSIQATRKTYKVCGKDPSRYRPSGAGTSTVFSPNARIRGITSSMSVTDVAAELLNSPPRMGQGSDVSLSAAMALCIATSAIREIISLLIFCSLYLWTKIQIKSQSDVFSLWDL